ncbi:Gfo/Idh/MocA family protein [Cellulophaga tyrosinoxydans]|uniref:Predicted dehydrogenase n=1 Tax=Cellulophaga tyrosinoxydans TaxID=504486 RepID=A0A1W2C3R1_9FLAO|nr:Gfo/Idh/MocA family oxidoreductase [Cellulophaga tyrosinoxydans]SMC79746.1 Predicted dehydrogenase [Cellulophaga tyrosinoxydans]
MIKKSTINWGIIGCGDVTEVKSGPAFQKTANSILVSVMRRNRERVEDYAIRHKVQYWTTNAADLIENKLVNAVYIATPPSSHLSYALQVLKAGKDVYLEKPMVLNTQEAKILTEALKNSESKVTIAHYRRRLPVFLKVKELLDAKIIGVVQFAEINIAQSNTANLIAKSDENWRLIPEISGGGYFHDIAPHQIDLMCHYFGEVALIEKINTEIKDSQNNLVCGKVVFKNGVQFKGNWNFNASFDKDNCIIYGDKGSITFSFYGNELTVVSENKEEKYNFYNPKHVQQPMIEKTVDYFLNKNSNPCSVEEAAVVAQIMEVFIV